MQAGRIGVGSQKHPCGISAGKRACVLKWRYRLLYPAANYLLVARGFRDLVSRLLAVYRHISTPPLERTPHRVDAQGSTR